MTQKKNETTKKNERKFMKEYTQSPIFFNRNRVYRVYTGGWLMEQFLNQTGEDNNFPEEWIASTVHAANNVNAKKDDGLSKIENTEITLKELGENYPREMYGKATGLGILVKYLDSAIRLPLQAHPDKAYAKKYFNSLYGKTEMWLILATREGANICFGFNNEITKEEFSAIVEESKEEKNIMDKYVNKVYVQPGEVYLIPAKAVHAIGAGCLILEIQEPTDFTLSPEYWCGDHLLSNQEMYMGLPKDTALECFDYSMFGKECIKQARKTPKLFRENSDVKIEHLITSEDTPCFSVVRYTVTKKVKLVKGAVIYIVTKGEGKIEGESYQREVKQGDYFFLPFEARDKFTAVSNKDKPLELIECIPPEE